jgi:hypothetical protein
MRKEELLHSMIIKVAIGTLLLLGLAFLMRANSIFATPSPELGVLMVQPDTSILRFARLGHFCGGKNHSWVSAYTTYAGKPLSVNGATFLSKSEARQYLQKQLQSATRIQETEKKYDQQGQVVGERIIAFFVFEGKEVASILSTEQESTLIITAESLAEALEFERTKIK